MFKLIAFVLVVFAVVGILVFSIVGWGWLAWDAWTNPARRHLPLSDRIAQPLIACFVILIQASILATMTCGALAVLAAKMDAGG